MAEAHEFEVRCPSCDVSFPPETRSCLHCGGRTGPARFQVAGLPSGIFARDLASESDSSAPFDDEGGPLPMGDPEPRSSPTKCCGVAGTQHPFSITRCSNESC